MRLTRLPLLTILLAASFGLCILPAPLSEAWAQTKTVNVYKLIAKGTIEERVLELQRKKRAIFDALMTESGDGLDALTWEDVRGLFEG